MAFSDKLRAVPEGLNEHGHSEELSKPHDVIVLLVWSQCQPERFKGLQFVAGGVESFDSSDQSTICRNRHEQVLGDSLGKPAREDKKVVKTTRASLVVASTLKIGGLSKRGTLEVPSLRL